MDKPQIFVYQEQQINYSCFSCSWLPESSKFATVGCNARNNGVISVYKVERNAISCIEELETQRSARCCTFEFNEGNNKNIAVGCNDGHLEIRDLEKVKEVSWSAKAHDDIINCIDGAGGFGAGKGQCEILTGSKDGSIKVWDQRQANSAVVEINPEENNKSRDCWSVAFGDCHDSESRIVACGFDNGEVKLFDLNAMKVWKTFSLPNGVSSLAFDRKSVKRNKLYCGTLEGGIFAIDLTVWHPEHEFARSKAENSLKKTTVWQVKPLPQCRDILLGSAGDGSLTLWKYDPPAKRTMEDDKGRKYNISGTFHQIQKSMTAQQPVTSFDLHKVRQGLAVQCSLDQVIRVIILTKLDSLI